MKKLILIFLLASGLFADECVWNVDMSLNELKKSVINVKEKDYIGAKYHIDMSLLYNMDALIKCGKGAEQTLTHQRELLLKNKSGIDAIIKQQ